MEGQSESKEMRFWMWLLKNACIRQRKPCFPNPFLLQPACTWWLERVQGLHEISRTFRLQTRVLIMHQVPCEPLGSLLGRLACCPFAERWLLCFCFKHQVISFLGLTLSIRPEKENHARQVWVYVKPPALGPECLVPHRPRQPPHPPALATHIRGASTFQLLEAGGAAVWLQGVPQDPVAGLGSLVLSFREHGLLAFHGRV